MYWALQREERFLEKESVVDFQVEEGDESSTRPDLNITCALAEREDIEGIQHAFASAGYSLTGIGLPLFALRNLVCLRAEVQQTPVLICQLGQLATSVSVLSEQRLVFSRNIPLGLNSLADALVKDLETKPSKEEATKLVLKLSSDEQEIPPKVRELNERVFHLLLPVLERMVRQIERTIQYYQSNFNSDPIETIFLGGETAAKGYLSDFISEQLSANVITIDPFDTPGLKVSGSLPEGNTERVTYGPAFGMALESGHAGANLAHTYQARQAESKHRKISMAVSFILILIIAVTGVFYGQKQSELKALTADKDKLNQTLNALGPRLSEAVIQEAAEEVKVLQEQRKDAAKRYEGLALLSEIIKLTPENISLLNISATMGRFIENLDEDEPVLVLQGVVDGERTVLETSLTIYIARLDQSPLFCAVEVDSTELVESADGLHLTFTLHVTTVEDYKEAKGKK